MTYTRFRLGSELKEKIENKLSATQIGKWAFEIYFNNCRYLDPEMSEIIQDLFMMEEGPQFEYTEQELMKIAENLINSDQDCDNKKSS